MATHTHTHTQTHTDTHLLDTSKGVAGEVGQEGWWKEVAKEAAILNKSVCIVVQLQQLNLSSAIARKMNHKCLVVIVIRNQPRRSAKSGSSEPDSLASLPQTDTHLSLEERNAGHVKCLGKLLYGHFPPVETVKVLEVVRQVQLLLTGTGWLALLNSRLANRANK